MYRFILFFLKDAIKKRTFIFEGLGVGGVIIRISECFFFPSENPWPIEGPVGVWTEELGATCAVRILKEQN